MDKKTTSYLVKVSSPSIKDLFVNVRAFASDDDNIGGCGVAELIRVIADDGLLEEEFINDDPNGVYHTIEIVRELENADRIDIDLTEDNIYTAVL